MGAQFPVEGGASHAQEYPKLFWINPALNLSSCTPSLYLHSNWPILQIRLSACAVVCLLREFTWIPCPTIRAPVIARDQFDELLESPFIACLVALGQGRGCHLAFNMRIETRA